MIWYSAARRQHRIKSAGLEVDGRHIRIAPSLRSLSRFERGLRLIRHGDRLEGLKKYARAIELDARAALLDWELAPAFDSRAGYGLEERMQVRWQEWSTASSGSTVGRLFAMGTKKKVHEWLQQEGVAAAPKIATAKNIHALDFSSLPDRYIIKPENASSSRGVFRVQGDDVRSLASWRKIKGPTAQDALLRRYKELALEGEEVIVEEAQRDVTDPSAEIPRDFKIFAVCGQAVFVQVLDRNGPKARKGMVTVARDWSALPQSSGWPELEPGPKPQGFDDAIKDVERLSKIFPMLLRWDFFLTPDGPRFCELTRFPNAGKSFRPWMERAIYQLIELDALVDSEGESGA